MKCLETRRTAEGHRRRRYQLDDGSRVSTIEVPVDLWERHQRTVRAAAVSAARPRAEQMLRAGAPIKTVAYDLNLSYSTVRRWAAEIKP